MRSKFFAIAIVSAVIASMTSPVAHAAANPKYPLSTKGNQIIDAAGNRVIWQGVNWYGMENEAATLIGLNARDSHFRCRPQQKALKSQV
jgi:endoglucanase